MLETNSYLSSTYVNDESGYTSKSLKNEILRTLEVFMKPCLVAEGFLFFFLRWISMIYFVKFLLGSLVEAKGH